MEQGKEGCIDDDVDRWLVAALQDKRGEVFAGYTTSRWPQLFVHGSLHCIFGRGRGSLILQPVTHVAVYLRLFVPFCSSDWCALSSAAHYLFDYHYCSSLPQYLT